MKRVVMAAALAASFLGFPAAYADDTDVKVPFDGSSTVSRSFSFDERSGRHELVLDGTTVRFDQKPDGTWIVLNTKFVRPQCSLFPERGQYRALLYLTLYNATGHVVWFDKIREFSHGSAANRTDETATKGPLLLDGETPVSMSLRYLGRC
jgi:hypothetical protein